MAVFHPHTVKCVCGNLLVAQLADSINVKRSPGIRDRILRGELHRTICPACKREMTVEKPFYYTDLERAAFFKVLPRGERHTWKSASQDLDRAAGLVPESMSSKNGRTLRVVFGMDELREKLIAQDAGLDDRVLELLKVFLIHEHPVLLRQARLRLTLDSVTPEAFEFRVAYEHNPRRFKITLPAAVASEVGGNVQQLQAWAKKSHPEASIFELPDHWVNLWRWSPQPTALDRLKEFAEKARQNQAVNHKSAAFKQMLKGLPRGSHLPAWAKQDLQVLFDYAKKKKLDALQDELFEIRFGIELEDDWSANKNADDIQTLWKLLRDLPDSNVEGNTKLHEILLDVGEGGGVYDPQSYDISIGSRELAVREQFEDVMRHEVGHAVHEQNDQLINDWLQAEFGWRIFDRDDAGIDGWVQLMGGWNGLSATQIKQVRQYLRAALGNGSSWSPGPTPSPPAGHPWYAADFGPRLAFEKSGANWFGNFKTWHRENGKAFFLNYWYCTLMAVDVKTLDLIAKMPDDYAAMSHFEFFAELYALYYDLDDPKRPVIPDAVQKWLKAKIGAPEVAAPLAPHMAGPPLKQEWETMTRPRRPRSK